MCLLRLSPVLPYNVLNYALAITPVPFWVFTLGSAVAALPWTALYVYLGTASTNLVDLAQARAGWWGGVCGVRGGGARTGAHHGGGRGQPLECCQPDSGPCVWCRMLAPLWLPVLMVAAGRARVRAAQGKFEHRSDVSYLSHALSGALIAVTTIYGYMLSQRAVTAVLKDAADRELGSNEQELLPLWNGSGGAAASGGAPSKGGPTERGGADRDAQAAPGASAGSHGT